MSLITAGADTIGDIGKNPAWKGSPDVDKGERGNWEYLNKKLKNAPLMAEADKAGWSVNEYGVKVSGNMLGPMMPAMAEGAFEKAGEDLRTSRMAALGDERSRLLAEYESAGGLQAVEGAPAGYRQSSAGTIVPGAPEFNSLFSVSEADAMAEASPRLKALKKEQALNEPRVGRTAWLPWAGRGFGLGKRGGEAAKEAIAEYGVGIESRKGAIMASATGDILDRRQTRERYRQNLYSQAMAEEAEADSARRFSLQIKLDEISDEESRIHARNMQEEDQAFQREQLDEEMRREDERGERAQQAEDAGKWWSNSYVNRGEGS